jgi:hypothetical protein
MEQSLAPDPTPTQLHELACTSDMARKLQANTKSGATMFDQILMFGVGAMALIVISTLVIAYFTMTRRKTARVAIPRVGKVIGRRKARPLPPLPAAQSETRAGEGALVHMVVDAQDYVQPQPPDGAPYELDVLRIRVPNVELDGGVGKRDAMSILLTTEYFDMIKKMGASRSSSTP